MTERKRVFIAGATGVLGRRLVPLLVEKGYDVTGLTRSASKKELLASLGARPVVADALDPQAMGQAISAAEPDIVVHEMTALADLRSLRNFEKAFEQNARLRGEGTDILLSASRAAGVRKFVAQCYGGFLFGANGKQILSEDDALDADPPKPFRSVLSADRHLEEVVTRAPWLEGIALRYGAFYGPGTSMSMRPPGVQSEMVRKGQFPIVGEGRGRMSFIHIDDAATATLAAIERGRRGIYHITDDEPAPVSEWLPGLAAAIGGKPPKRIPKWLARVLAGPAVVAMMTETVGASNAKAKRELDWELRYPSWRSGFVHGLN